MELRLRRTGDITGKAPEEGMETGRGELPRDIEAGGGVQRVHKGAAWQPRLAA